MDFFKNKPFLIGFTIVVVLSLAGFGGYIYMTRTPEYSVHQAGDALRAKDWDKFNRYVDVRAVLDKSADALVEDYLKEQNLDAKQIGIARSAVHFLKPQIISLAENQIKITFFSFEDDEVTSDSNTAAIESSKKPKKSPNRLKLESMTSEYLPNDFAIITIHFSSDDPNDREKKIAKVKMKKEKDHWQAIEILNLPEILKWPESDYIFSK